jgi:low affinity Fe/Cu permease
MRAFVQVWVVAFREHRLLTYATAIAMRALIGLVIVTTYLYISSIVFLVGAQLDEFLRPDAKGKRKVGIHQLARRVF